MSCLDHGLGFDDSHDAQLDHCDGGQNHRNSQDMNALENGNEPKRPLNPMAERRACEPLSERLHWTIHLQIHILSVTAELGGIEEPIGGAHATGPDGIIGERGVCLDEWRCDCAPLLCNVRSGKSD